MAPVADIAGDTAAVIAVAADMPAEDKPRSAGHTPGDFDTAEEQTDIAGALAADTAEHTAAVASDKRLGQPEAWLPPYQGIAADRSSPEAGVAVEEPFDPAVEAVLPDNKG